MRIGKLELGNSQFLRMSFASTVLSAAAKLAMGVMMQSVLVLINAFYNIVLCVPRAAALFFGVGTGAGQPQTARERAERAAQIEAAGFQTLSAIALAVLGAVFVVYSYRMLVTGEHLQYSEIPAITFATCAFAKIGTAIYGVVKERHSSDGSVFTAKLTNLADAMASIALTQTLLRGTQGQGGDVFDAAFGIAVGAAIIGMGAWILIHTLRTPRRKPTPRHRRA